MTVVYLYRENENVNNIERRIAFRSLSCACDVDLDNMYSLANYMAYNLEGF